VNAAGTGLWGGGVLLDNACEPVGEWSSGVKRFIVETYQIQEIPVAMLAEESAARRPVVFYVHGFGADKREGLALGYRLAESGFFFVSLDAPMHGERPDERLEAVPEGRADLAYPAGTGLDSFFLMHELIVQTAQDIGVLIQHLDKDSRVDTSRIGMTGASMGGFATFYTAAHNPRIQVAVPMIGIPAFVERWKDVVLEAAAYEKWADAMEAAQDETSRRSAFMAAIDPFDKMKTFFPRPLMMINGDQDLDSPKKYSVNLYRMLKPLYAACPRRLRLNIHDDAGHRVTVPMMEDACDWFSRYL
jgi:dienelactone hydrolase